MLLKKTNTRRAATTVEMGVVSILLFMMLFGILEYCRLLYFMHVANSSARDAARFAVVHTNGGTMPGEPTSISTADLEAIVRTGKLGSTVIGTGLGGMDRSFDNLTVEIFAVDPVALAQTPPVVQAAPGTTWNNATFSQKIAVRIRGEFKPMVPPLLFMDSAIPVQITVMASSEAN